MTVLRRLWKYLILLVLPAVLLFSVLKLREEWGAYYFTHNADPAYLYLINSLNVATLCPVQHVDNPGTTVQLLGGAVLRVLAFFQETKDLEADVFLRPEYYLTNINRTLFAINLIGMVAIGFAAWHWTKSVTVGILLQCAPFVSYQMIKAMLMVSPEPVSVTAALLFMLLIMWASVRNAHEEHPGLFALLSAMIVSFSLATKFTFIVFALMPLMILKGWKWRIAYVVMVVFFFHILIIPAFTHYDFFLHWIKILFLHTDNYGQGATGIVNPGSFAANMLKIAALEHTYFFILAFASGLLILIFTKNVLREIRAERSVRLLIALVTASVIHAALVAKHYNPRYMIPALMLMPVIIYLSVIVYKRLADSGQMEFTPTLTFMAILTAAFLVLFLARHFMGYLPGDTIVVWRQTIANHSSLADCIPDSAFSNSLFIIFLVFALATATLLARSRIKRSGNTGFLTVMCLLCMGVIYHIRHVDISGFNHRNREEKREVLAVMDEVEKKYGDYIKIFGGRSSSQLYALKYGTSTNFTRASQLARLNELYPGTDTYFWRLKWGDSTFDNWTKKVALTDIMSIGDNILIQGDMSSLNPVSVEEMERLNNVKLTEVYRGKTEIIYKIKSS